MCTASSGSAMSPLAMTGMFTACFTSRIMSQSALPAYIWARVRPWTATASAPADSISWANSTALTLPLSQPLRILTVTGLPQAAFTAVTI